jgi:hypothetical protein
MSTSTGSASAAVYACAAVRTSQAVQVVLIQLLCSTQATQAVTSAVCSSQVAEPELY